jgi:hypothetical protein
MSLTFLRHSCAFACVRVPLLDSRGQLDAELTASVAALAAAQQSTAVISQSSDAALQAAAEAQSTIAALEHRNQELSAR